MNVHERARRLAAEALDFELDRGERHALADHLSTCNPCRAFDTSIRGDDAALRATAWQPAPSRVRETVAGTAAARGRDGLVAVRGRVWSPLGVGPTASPARVAIVVALLAALLVGITFSGLLAGGRPLAIVPAPSRPQASLAASPVASVVGVMRSVAVRTTIPVCSGANDLQAAGGALWFMCGGTIWRADVAMHSSRAIVAGTALATGDAGVWALDTAAVLKLDPATGAVLARVPHVGGTALAVGSGAVWVANGNAGTVTRIDPVSNRVSATITVGANPVAIVAGANAVWVADQGTASTGAPNSADNLWRIDPATDTVAATLAVVHGYSPLLFIAGAVWVANDAAATLSGINPLTNSVTRIQLDTPVWDDVLPAAAVLDRGWLWVIDARTDELVIIAPGPAKGTQPNVDPTTASVTERLTVPGIVPGSAAHRLPSIAFLDGVLWISDAAGSLIEVST